MDYLASNFEVLVKTEPFLRFKKDLFKRLLQSSNLNEEVLRRKFYKFLDYYLHKRSVDERDFDDLDTDFLLKELDLKFKTKNEGSFIVQGMNVGYIKDNIPIWVRHYEFHDEEDIKTYL